MQSPKKSRLVYKLRSMLVWKTWKPKQILLRKMGLLMGLRSVCKNWIIKPLAATRRNRREKFLDAGHVPVSFRSSFGLFSLLYSREEVWICPSARCLKPSSLSKRGKDSSKQLKMPKKCDRLTKNFGTFHLFFTLVLCRKWNKSSIDGTWQMWKTSEMYQQWKISIFLEQFWLDV